jgi:hypothetical protein
MVPGGEFSHRYCVGGLAEWLIWVDDSVYPERKQFWAVPKESTLHRG